MNVFSKIISLKRKQPNPELELGSSCPSPKMITVTPRAVTLHVKEYVQVCFGGHTACTEGFQYHIALIGNLLLFKMVRCVSLYYYYYFVRILSCG